MQRKYSFKSLLVGVVITIYVLLCCLRLLKAGSGKPALSGAASAEFQAIQAETPLAGTHYQIEYANQNITLRNTFTPATFSVIKRYSLIATPPAYQLISHAQRPYLMIRLGSGGNSGAYWFKIYDLSGTSVRDMTAASSAPDMGLSCNAPVLEQDSLKFVISTNCRFGAADSIRVYWLPLR